MCVYIRVYSRHGDDERRVFRSAAAADNRAHLANKTTQVRLND